MAFNMCRHLLLFGLLTIAAARQIRDISSRKIVGGKPVEIEQFPFQLSLELYEGHYCGASILNPTHAITAAHCVQSGTKDDYRLRAGTSIQESSGTLHAIEEIIPHPQYNAALYDFDAAVIRVKDPFEYSDTTQPIAIGETTPKKNAMVTVSGWGDLTEGGIAPTQLHAVTVPVVDTEECSLDYEGRITDRMFCAGKAGRDSCQGDSGGPITINGTLIGVVSWGRGCAEPNYPGVYTRLASTDLRAWVKENSGS